MSTNGLHQTDQASNQTSKFRPYFFYLTYPLFHEQRWSILPMTMTAKAVITKHQLSFPEGAPYIITTRVTCSSWWLIDGHLLVLKYFELCPSIISLISTFWFWLFTNSLVLHITIWRGKWLKLEAQANNNDRPSSMRCQSLIAVLPSAWGWRKALSSLNQTSAPLAPLVAI